MQCRHHGWWLMGLFCLLSGCAHPMWVSSFEVPTLPTISKSSIRLDFSALPTDLGPSPADASYRGLTEAECPCLAARASTLGNLLDQKAQSASQRESRCPLRAGKTSEQSFIVLQNAADEARLRSAGEAMEAFYHLVEAEGRGPLLLLGLKEINDSLKRAEELQTKGLPPPVEITVIRKQLTDLHSDEVNLRIAILQLNARLKVLLGLPSGDYSLWPKEDLKVVPEETDINLAVDYGLHHRPDLALLESLADGLDSNSRTKASQALGALSPLLSESSSPCFFASLLACLDNSKSQSVQQQVQTLLMDRRRQATHEIQQAAGLVAYRVQLVILARQKFENEEKRIKELEEKKAKGLDAEAELSTARLNLYKAQGELLREVVNWKIARAQLRQAQGRLLEECPGFGHVASGATPNESVPCCRTLSECD